MKITPLENIVLNYLLSCEHASDGHGICGWLYLKQWDMKVYRGVISSLYQKGIVTKPYSETQDIEDGPVMWLAVTTNFQICDPDDKWSGYRLTNVELVK